MEQQNSFIARFAISVAGHNALFDRWRYNRRMKVASITLCFVYALLAQGRDAPIVSATNSAASGRNASRRETVNHDPERQLSAGIKGKPVIGSAQSNPRRAPSGVAIAQMTQPDVARPSQELPESSIDKSGDVSLRGKISAEAADAKRMGATYDVLAYGADPTGKTDSTAALQLAIQKAAESPVVLPAGKYVISAPLMCYTLPGKNRTYVAGCKIQGAGFGKTQLLLSPSFRVPPSVDFHGVTVHVTPAAIDIQGVLDTTGFGSFQYGGEVSRLEIAPEGCEVNPNPGELPCAYTPSPSWMTGGANGIAGISIEGAWNFDIHDNYIHFMSGDGVFFPERLDIAKDGDLTQSFAPHIYHNDIDRNEGWGINLGTDTTGDDVDQNLIEQNSLGGIRVTALFNRIRHNSIASNGCGQKLGGKPGHSVTCTTSPLGPGIYIGRDYGAVGAPYQDTIEDNEFDSNAAEQVDVSTATNLILQHNLFFTHTTGYVYNDTLPGAQNIPKQQVLLGDVAAVNTAIEFNLQRADFECAAGHPVPSAGCRFPNSELDPEVAGINFNPSGTRSTYVNQNVFRTNVAVGNYQPYVRGAGMVTGVPEMGPASGSPARQSVVSWPLLDGGIGFVAAPGLTAVGGDSAWRQPTLLMLTQRDGALATCTVEQGGGPYNRPPVTSVQDADGTGSGGAISLSLSSGSPGSYTARSCAITSAGSGYGHPMGGVAPVCARQPVVRAVPSRGIGEITVSNGGNYGPWTAGEAPPHVTATIRDATGSGYDVNPVMAPVNTNMDPRTAPAVHWQVVAVTIKSRGDNSTAPAVVFSAAPGQIAATGTVVMAHVLNKALQIVDPGSCDAGATPWLVASLPAYPARNHELNAIYENNVIMSAPDVKGARTQAAVNEGSADPPPAENSARTHSVPGWNMSFAAQIPTPRAGATYYISTNSLISASADKGSTWPASAPFGCTLSSVQYLASMQGVRDSQADDFTLKVYDLTSGRGFDDTAGKIALNASSYPMIPQLLPSDSVRQGDKLLLEAKAPPSYGKQPTNVYLAGQIWCR